ncbi:hypothetical protein APHAL10511_003887 [Amanita phalloides]|nr:hypothetical protein APHAL10511_003887 [Amanita phalloides]
MEVAESHLGMNLAAAITKILQDFQISDKILSITCDNALANTTMIDELQDMLPEFGRQATHTQCFLHTTNLIMKALLSQFDVKKNVKKGKAIKNEGTIIKNEDGSWEEEEWKTIANTASADAEDEGDNIEGLLDVADEMEAEEQAAHEECIHPVKSVLTKVRFNAHSPVSLYKLPASP